MCANMHTNMRMDMGMDICIEMCTDMSMNMRTNMCMDMPTHVCVLAHMSIHSHACLHAWLLACLRVCERTAEAPGRQGLGARCDRCQGLGARCDMCQGLGARCDRCCQYWTQGNIDSLPAVEVIPTSQHDHVAAVQLNCCNRVHDLVPTQNSLGTARVLGTAFNVGTILVFACYSVLSSHLRGIGAGRMVLDDADHTLASGIVCHVGIAHLIGRCDRLRLSETVDVDEVQPLLKKRVLLKHTINRSVIYSMKHG